jgi:hypothetical protein
MILVDGAGCWILDAVLIAIGRENRNLCQSQIPFEQAINPAYRQA